MLIKASRVALARRGRRRAALTLQMVWRAAVGRRKLRRRRASAHATISNAFRRLAALRAARRELGNRRVQRAAARQLWAVNHAAACRIGRSWVRAARQRRAAARVQGALVIQSNIRGFLTRERCPLLAGGKTAFEYPRRLEECAIPFEVGMAKLNAKGKADLAFVITALKTDRSLKLRVLGCTQHTEAIPLGMQRAKTVLDFLTSKGVLRQQLRAERCPPNTVGGLVEYGTCAARFVVVQSILLPKRLTFAPNSAELPPNAPPMLEKVVRTLQAHPTLRLVLEGHADAWELQQHELSSQRASTIKRWLRDNGARCTVDLMPCGGRCPVATNLTAQGRRHNRRIELQIRMPQ